MQDRIVKSLQNISNAADYLLLETVLNDVQQQFVQAIYNSCKEMIELVISFPPFDTTDKASEVFDFEARSDLASIIGYAELLLDGDDGELDDEQVQRVQTIRNTGKQVVRLLPEE